MHIEVKRIFLGETYTIGKMYLDGIFVNDTLEDKVRDINKDGDLNDPGETKVWGQTAIPYGTYKVDLLMSPKFKKVLPRLSGVKGFEGILIHEGNIPEHTHGCILVGVNSQKGKLTDSKKCFKELMDQLVGQKNLTITIS